MKMIAKLYHIILKNLRILFRGRGFTLGILLAPLIITAIMGSVFSDNGMNSIHIGIVDKSPEKVSDNLLRSIDKEHFSFNGFDEVYDCRDSITQGQTHACIYFDETFTLDGEKRNSLQVYADYSKINLVWQVVNSITAALTNSTKEESLGMVEELLDQLEDYETKMDNNSEKIDSVEKNIEEIEKRLSDTSKRIDVMNTDSELSVREDIETLSGEIDEFRESIEDISEKQTKSEDDITSFRTTIVENRDSLGTFRQKFEDTKSDFESERSDCQNLNSYAHVKYSQYDCDSHPQDTGGQDAIETLYLKCKKVHDELSLNLATVTDADNACYLLVNTIDLSQDKVDYLTEEIDELKDMINTTENMQQDLDSSIQSLDSMKQSMDSTTGDLDNIDSSLEDTKDNLATIENEIDEFTAAKSQEMAGIKNDMKLDIDNMVYYVNLNKESLSSIMATFNDLKGSDARKKISAEGVINPIEVVIKPVTEKDSSFDYIAPILLAVMIAFSAVLVSTLLSIHENTGNTNKRNIITPTSNWLFIFGMYLTNIILLFIQMSIFIAVLVYFGTYTPSNIMTLMIALLTSGSAFILTGMLIASLSSKEQSAIFTALSYLLLIIFFSEILVPVEKISSGLMVLSEINPLNMAIAIFRKTILFGFGTGPIAPELAALGLISLSAFIATYIFTVKSPQR